MPMCVAASKYVCIDMCAYTCVCMSLCVCECVCVCVHVCVCAHMCFRVYHDRIHILGEFELSRWRSFHVNNRKPIFPDLASQIKK